MTTRSPRSRAASVRAFDRIWFGVVDQDVHPCRRGKGLIQRRRNAHAGSLTAKRLADITPGLSAGDGPCQREVWRLQYLACHEAAGPASRTGHTDPDWHQATSRYSTLARSSPRAAARLDPPIGLCVGDLQHIRLGPAHQAQGVFGAGRHAYAAAGAAQLVNADDLLQRQRAELAAIDTGAAAAAARLRPPG